MDLKDLVEALVLNPARAQVRAAVRGGKEAGAWRRVLLPPESGCPLCKRWLQPEREGAGGKSPSNPTSTQATGGKDSGWLLPLALQVLCLYLCSVHTSFSHSQYGFMKTTFWIYSDSWLTVMVTKKPLEGEFHSSNNALHSSSVCSWVLLICIVCCVLKCLRSPNCDLNCSSSLAPWIPVFCMLYCLLMCWSPSPIVRWNCSRLLWNVPHRLPQIVFCGFSPQLPPGSLNTSALCPIVFVFVDFCPQVPWIHQHAHSPSPDGRYYAQPNIEVINIWKPI